MEAVLTDAQLAQIRSRYKQLQTNQGASETFLNQNKPGTDLIVEKGSKNLGINDFLKLLTTQLANQDPLEPMKDMSCISQMSTLSSMEQMNQLNQTLTGFISDQRGIGYLGKEVLLYLEGDRSKTPVVGVVTNVEKTAKGDSLVTINEIQYESKYIAEVRLNPTEKTA